MPSHHLFRSLSCVCLIVLTLSSGCFRVSANRLVDRYDQSTKVMPGTPNHAILEIVTEKESNVMIAVLTIGPGSQQLSSRVNLLFTGHRIQIDEKVYDVDEIKNTLFLWRDEKESRISLPENVSREEVIAMAVAIHDDANRRAITPSESE